VKPSKVVCNKTIHMKNTTSIEESEYFYVVKPASSYIATRYQFKRVFRLPLYSDNEGTKIVQNDG